MVIVLPTMAGFAPYRRQNPFESNTTLSWPGCSSSVAKLRPSAGLTPISGKKVRRNAKSLHAPALGIRQIEINKAKMSHPLEDMVLFPPVEITRRGGIDEVASLLVIHLSDKNKPVRILPGNRAQQDRVHHPEHGGICADA